MLTENDRSPCGVVNIFCSTPADLLRHLFRLSDSRSLKYDGKLLAAIAGTESRRAFVSGADVCHFF